jgi:hypothetical protein
MTGYVVWIDLLNTTQICFARFLRLNQRLSHEPAPSLQRFLLDIEGCLPSGALSMHVSWTTAIPGLPPREMTGNRSTLRHALPLYSRPAAVEKTMSNEATRQPGNRASLLSQPREVYISTSTTTFFFSRQLPTHSQNDGFKRGFCNGSLAVVFDPTITVC